ncbi:MAG: hypothetical protein Q9201_006365 [Fulgogasparrea decipioides]
MIRADFEQVKCPVALTNKTGCVRNDETPSKIHSPSIPESSTSPPSASRLGTGAIIAISIAGPLFLVNMGFAGYCVLQRHNRSMSKKTAKDGSSLSSDRSPDSPTENEPSELAAGTENLDQGVHELFPACIQQVDSADVHQLDTVRTHELEPRSVRKDIVGGQKVQTTRGFKPLPKLPAELKGSPV